MGPSLIFKILDYSVKKHIYKEFKMKNFILSFMVLSCLPAFAQEYHFIPQFSEVKFEKNRKLSKIENEQKKLLSCVTKFIKGNKAEEDGPKIIHDLLKPLMENGALTEDKVLLDETTDICESLLDQYPSIKNKYTNRNEILKRSSKFPNNKLGYFIAHQYFNLFNCKAYDVSATAGFLVALSTGVGNFKCLLPSGVVRNYVGARFKVTYGFGVKVGYSETAAENWDGRYKDAAIAFITDHITLEDDQGVLIVSAFNGSSTVSLDFGLGFFGEPGTANLGLRFFNGKRNWGYLIDQLK